MATEKKPLIIDTQRQGETNSVSPQKTKPTAKTSEPTEMSKPTETNEPTAKTSEPTVKTNNAEQSTDNVGDPFIATQTVESLYQTLINQNSHCNGLYPNEMFNWKQWGDEVGQHSIEPPLPKVCVDLNKFPVESHHVVKKRKASDQLVSENGDYFFPPHLKKRASSDTIDILPKTQKAFANEQELFLYMKHNSLKFANKPRFMCEQVALYLKK